MINPPQSPEASFTYIPGPEGRLPAVNLYHAKGAPGQSAIRGHVPVTFT